MPLKYLVCNNNEDKMYVYEFLNLIVLDNFLNYIIASMASCFNFYLKINNYTYGEIIYYI